MARRKTKSKRRSTGWKIPILPTAGLVGGLTASVNDRSSIAKSAVDNLAHRNFTDFGSDLLVQTIGIDPRDRGFRIPTFTVMVGLGVLMERIMNKIARGAFRGLPIRW